MSNDTRRNVGTIVERGGRYLARIEVGVRADGSRRTMSKTFGTRAEAETWLRQQSVELGKRPDFGAGVTLSKLWPLYAKSRADALTKKAEESQAAAQEAADRAAQLLGEDPVTFDADITATSTDTDTETTTSNAPSTYEEDSESEDESSDEDQLPSNL